MSEYFTLPQLLEQPAIQEILMVIKSAQREKEVSPHRILPKALGWDAEGTRVVYVEPDTDTATDWGNHRQAFYNKPNFDQALPGLAIGFCNLNKADSVDFIISDLPSPLGLQVVGWVDMENSPLAMVPFFDKLKSLLIEDVMRVLSTAAYAPLEFTF